MQSTLPKTARLRTVPGQRRGAPRSAGFQPIAVMVQLAGGARLPASLESIDYGEILLRADASRWTDAADVSSIESLVDDSGAELLHGNWPVATTRNEGESLVISARHPSHAWLTELDSLVTPETFLRTNQHRILSLEKTDDVALISRFFTELKDCPLPVAGDLRDGSRRIRFQFDFSSGKRSLETLDLKIEKSEAETLRQTSTWIADFKFLSVRYLLPLTLRSYDEDWELAEVSFDRFLLAVTNRIHERHACRIPIVIETGADLPPAAGTIVQINGEGGLIRLSEDTSFDRFLGTEITFTTAPGGVTFRAVGVRITRGRIAFHFVKDGRESISTLSHLIFSHLEEPVVPRHAGNYGEFLNLYANVGYGPADSDARSRWKAQTTETWSQVDRAIPNSCLGHRSGDASLACSVGSVPWGPNTVYAHSLAMIKDLDGALGVFDQMVLTLAWMALLPGVRRYAGAFATTSRFTTRLQTNFEHSGVPRSQWTVFVNLLYYNEVSELPRSNEYELVPSNQDSLSHALKEAPLRALTSNISQSNPLVEHLHKVETFLVRRTSDQKNVGVVVKNDSPPYYTAVDVFRRTWIFDWYGSLDVAKVCALIKYGTGGLPGPVAHVREDGSVAPTESPSDVRSIPVMWLFTDKDDVGTLVASTARAAYHISRKYSGEEASALRRVLFL